MKVNSISILYNWEDIDIESDNVDVYVNTDDNYTYIISVTTIKHFKSLMEDDNYFSPGYPFVFVKKITKEIVEETMKAYAEESDGYWLKVYHYGGCLGWIDETVFEHLKSELIKKYEEVEEIE